MTSQTESSAWRDGVPLSWIFALVLRGRRTIFGAAAIGFIVALAIALLRATYYTATFAFIPQSAPAQARGGLASIAGQFGINVGSLGGQGESPQLYADLLQTNAILATIAPDTVADATGRPVPLSRFLGVKGDSRPVVMQRTVQNLRDKVITTSVATRTTGMVTVAVRTKSPRASYLIAQQLLNELNQFNLATRRTQAGEERRFVEQRLSEARDSLRRSEDALQQFLQGNRQYANSPQLGFVQQRLQREVSLQQQVVTELAQQYEDARIREVRDTPVITVLEPPTLPVLPDPGGRALTVILGTLGAVAVGTMIVLVRGGLARRRDEDGADESDALLAAEWQRLRNRVQQV